MVRSVFPLFILRMIYMALVYSHINYCILVWGSADNIHLEQLFKLQKKAIRLITNSHYLEHTAPLFKSLKLLNIYKVYELNCILFIYKCLNCNYLPELRLRIQRNSDYHAYNTRGRNLFRNSNINRLKICQRSFLNFGINAWNLLTADIKDSNTIHRLKTVMKLHLLEVD